MRKKLLLALVTAVFLLSVALVGCQGGGIAQEEHDRVVAQLENEQAEVAEAQTQLTGAQNELDDLTAEKAAVDAELAAAQAELATAQAEIPVAQARIAELEAQVSSLREQYELVGETVAETVEKIVKYYHDTHVYTAYDLFVCADMAAEIWNMLEAQGINSIMVVGNKDTAIEDILLSNHTWVLAEVAPGEYLALEATGGYVVLESDNPLYYRGWSFDSPADIKDYQNLVREYNTRVSIRNELAAEDREVVDLYNQSTNQQEADQLLAVHDKLAELILQHESVLISIKAEIESLATECGG